MDTFSFEEIKKQIPEWIKPDSINPNDIPSIELYMDQVTTFMERELSGNKRYEDDKILTKTMINNYSKNDLLPPSEKKKYSKEHIILLIYIYYLKNFLSINDIQRLLNPMSDTYFGNTSKKSMEDIYKDLYALEKEYGVKIEQDIKDVCELAEKTTNAEDDYLKTFSLIALLSYDIYSKKQLIEKMIDSLPDNSDKKNEKNSEKKAEKKNTKK